MKKITKYEYRPSGWQINPETITSNKVQYWSNGTMITAQITNEKAKNMIKNGEAFAISSQAIGQMINGVSFS